jgi:phosphotriesterase-related protein
MAGTSDVDELAEIYVDHAVNGTGGIKAGIYGEVGTSLDEITPGEEVHLRAVARAHAATGLAISTHCTLGTMALDQVEILISEGVDPSRVVVGHMDLRPDVDYLEKVLRAGVNLGFDTWGKEWFDYRVPGSGGDGPGEFVKWAYHRSDHDRVAALTELCARGYDDRIVLSCDMSGAEAWLNQSTHGRHGYSYLPKVVFDQLRQVGVSEASLHRMLVENPAKILAIP